MTVRASLPQRARHVPIVDDDWVWLEKAYGPTSESKMGVGPAIRSIIHTFVTGQKAKEQKLLDARGTPAPAAQKENIE